MEDNIQGRRPQRNKTIEQFYLQNYRQFELSLALLSPKLSFLFAKYTVKKIGGLIPMRAEMHWTSPLGDRSNF